MKRYQEWVNLHEAVPANQLSKITVVCRDQDGTLKKLLEHIKAIGNVGHSFSIIVDPNGDDKQRFDWDGDGSDYIKEVSDYIQEETLLKNNA